MMETSVGGSTTFEDFCNSITQAFSGLEETSFMKANSETNAM